MLDILETWSFWERDVPQSVARDVVLPAKLVDNLCLVIQGVRRCGKSTLLTQLMAHYELERRDCAFVNFEDPRLSGKLDFNVLDELTAAFRAARSDSERRVYFLDEIQWVDGWQRWIRTRLDRPNGDVFIVTGSNADLLGGELSTTLTGRHRTIELYPFSFAEASRANPATTAETYLHDGGFPAPLRLSDGDMLRRQYFNDIVERDVRERLNAKSSVPIRQVAQMVMESAGSELSLRRIAGAAGIAVDTAKSYLAACEAAYLIGSCPYFAFSERKRAGYNRKYYPIDTGLRRAVVTRTGADVGKSLECAVYIALRQRYGQVSYWREGGEVDFVVRNDGRIVPIQVTWDEPSERHHRALERFYERFPQADEAVFVTHASYQAFVEDLELSVDLSGSASL